MTAKGATPVQSDSEVANIIGQGEYAEIVNDAASAFLPQQIRPDADKVYDKGAFTRLLNDFPKVLMFVTPRDDKEKAIPVGYNGMWVIVNAYQLVEVPEPIAAILRNTYELNATANRTINALIDAGENPAKARLWTQANLPTPSN